MIRSLKPFVPSGDDYDLARRFFLALGFTPDWEVEGLAQLRLGDGVFILQNFTHLEMQQNFMVQVNVEDLDAFWSHLQSCGALDLHPTASAKPPTDYPWGNREVHLIDPAGVCWHFV